MLDDINILYSDKYLLVVSKPAGLLSVPGRGEHKKDCLISRVMLQFPTARIVHRLDCATSGLMVVALTADSHRELSRQFHDREVRKRYIACVAGRVAHESGKVELPLMTDWPNRPRQIVHQEGKPALTYYRCLSFAELAGQAMTRLELSPVTGRSHQLRVHMQALGHPIVGDDLYADPITKTMSERLLLHAEYLAFSHPDSGQELEFELDASF